MRDIVHTMDKYLIYQLEDGSLQKSVIKDLPAAKKLVYKSETQPIKLGGKKIHIVGVGTEEDFKSHKEILEPAPYNEKPGFKKLKEDIEYFKVFKEWPK